MEREVPFRDGIAARSTGSPPRHRGARGMSGAPAPAERQLALLGGEPLFVVPRSASNLVQPDPEAFFGYSRLSFDEHRFTNGGPAVRLLEERLASFHHARRCVSFSSGFWALVIAMRTLALPGRSEVVMPSLTYRRMADAAAWAGLVPRFCEVGAPSLAVTAETVAACIGEESALVLGVHPIVNCCDAAGLESLGGKVPILFDSVESCYETAGGRKVGSFGAGECFSMHASKLINGFEGGYVTTNDHAFADEIALVRGFGFNGQDDVRLLGFNAKLNEVHAAMALASLDDLPRQVLGNRARYRRYQEELAGISGLRLVEFDESERCSYKTILVEVEKGWPLSRSETLAALHAEGVLARPYYSPPLHTRATSYPTRFGSLELTEHLAGRFMLLPCGARVSDDDIRQICRLLVALGHQRGALGEDMAH